MTIKVTCPNGHKLAAKESKAGQTARCPACGAPVQIPKMEAKGCTDSTVLRILGLGEQLRHARMESDDNMRVTQDFLVGSGFKQKPQVRTTQICPQCDWEIDAGYRVCPHCRCYLVGNQ